MRLGKGNLFEKNSVARFQLGNLGKIAGQDRGDLGIASAPQVI